MSLIRVNNLSAFYENRQIFKDLNFSVNEGDYLCITGENGSGKTTLMRLLLGFKVKHTGNINLEGFKNCEIGYLPQRTVTESDFPASVKEVILSGFCGKSFLGLGVKRAQYNMALENMKYLEIEDLENRFFRELSGGQQQKVLLCRAMCAAKKLLLLDEPVAALDTDSKTELYRLIKKLNSDGMTIIMISHDISRALTESSHILNIHNKGYTFSKTSDYKETGEGKL